MAKKQYTFEAEFNPLTESETKAQLQYILHHINSNTIAKIYKVVKDLVDQRKNVNEALDKLFKIADNPIIKQFKNRF